MEGLTFDQFTEQSQPVKTPLNSEKITFWTCGLAGEVAEFVEVAWNLVRLHIHSGRLANIAKKFDRDQPWQADRQDALDEALISEAGNVLFYLDKVLQKRGFTLNNAAAAEIYHLEGMRERGTL